MTPDQRIAKLLARAGVASRREIERMIAEGRIALNGTTIDTPATLLSTLDGITVDGKPVAAPEPTRLFLYHKPTGLLVTEHDPAGRPTIYDRLPEGLPRLVPVGRLDLNTEGLLLLTTDGGFKRQLELPATGVERTYRARAYGDITQAQLEELIHGIEIDGIRYGQIDANLERRTGANVWIEMTLREGKNREVRRVLEHLGLQVSRLIRLRYGPFLLDDLPAGEIGEVKGHDIVEFRRTLEGGIPADAVKPVKPTPGFRTPPARATSDRPTRSAPPSDRPRSPERAGSTDRPRTPDRKPYGTRSGGNDGRSSAPYGGNERPGRNAGDRPTRSGPPSDRARGPDRYATSDRSYGSERKAPGGRSGGHDGRSSAPYAGRERSGQSTGDRARGSDRPYASERKAPGARSGGQNDRSFAPREGRGRDDARPARGRTDGKPYAKSPSNERDRPTGQRPSVRDDRQERPNRAPRGPQGSSPRPGGAGGPRKPGGFGSRPGGGGRPGRPGGNR